MNQSKFRSFITGAFVGVGLGILLASKDSENKNDLKKSFGLLVDTIKNIDVEETKKRLLEKVSEIKKELSTIDEVTVKELAQEKIDTIKEKCTDLMLIAKEEGAPVVEKAASEVKELAHQMLSNFLVELESSEEEKKEVKKKTSSKKSPAKTSAKKKSTKNTAKKKTTKKS